jgi:hypothetical protein
MNGDRGGIVFTLPLQYRAVETSSRAVCDRTTAAFSLRTVRCHSNSLLEALQADFDLIGVLRGEGRLDLLAIQCMPGVICKETSEQQLFRHVDKRFSQTAMARAPVSAAEGHIGELRRLRERAAAVLLLRSLWIERVRRGVEVRIVVRRVKTRDHPRALGDAISAHLERLHDEPGLAIDNG